MNLSCVASRVSFAIPCCVQECSGKSEIVVCYVSSTRGSGPANYADSWTSQTNWSENSECVSDEASTENTEKGPSLWNLETVTVAKKSLNGLRSSPKFVQF